MLTSLFLGIYLSYIAELFDTKNRSFAISLSLIFAKICSGSATYWIMLMDSLNLNPFIVSFFGSILGLVGSMTLPETKGKGLQN